MRRGMHLVSVVSILLEVGIGYITDCCKDRSMVVPGNQASRVGLAPDQVKISQKYGDGYPANVEGLHQLHCLVCEDVQGQTRAAC